MKKSEKNFKGQRWFTKGFVEINMARFARKNWDFLGSFLNTVRLLSSLPLKYMTKSKSWPFRWELVISLIHSRFPTGLPTPDEDSRMWSKKTIAVGPNVYDCTTNLCKVTLNCFPFLPTIPSGIPTTKNRVKNLIKDPEIRKIQMKIRPIQCPKNRNLFNTKRLWCKDTWTTL